MILSSFQLVADKVGNYSPSEECKNAHKTMINPFGTVLGWIQFHDPSKILSDGRGSQTSALEFNLKSHLLQMLLQSQGPSFLHSVNSNMQAVQIANICGKGVVVGTHGVQLPRSSSRSGFRIGGLTPTKLKAVSKVTCTIFFGYSTFKLMPIWADKFASGRYICTQSTKCTAQYNNCA